MNAIKSSVANGRLMSMIYMSIECGTDPYLLRDWLPSGNPSGSIKPTSILIVTDYCQNAIRIFETLPNPKRRWTNDGAAVEKLYFAISRAG